MPIFRISASETASSCKLFTLRLPPLTKASVSWLILLTDTPAPMEASLLAAITAATVNILLSLSAFRPISAFFARPLSMSVFVMEASTFLFTRAAAAAPCTATEPEPPTPTPIVKRFELSCALTSTLALSPAVVKAVLFI